MRSVDGLSQGFAEDFIMTPPSGSELDQPLSPISSLTDKPVRDPDQDQGDSHRRPWLWLLVLLLLVGTGLYVWSNARFRDQNRRLEATQTQMARDRAAARAKASFDKLTVNNLIAQKLKAEEATIKDLTVTGKTNLNDLLSKVASFSSTTTGTATNGDTITNSLLVRGATTLNGPTTVNNTFNVSGQTTLADLITSGQLKLTGNQNDLLLIQPSQDNGQHVFTIRDVNGSDRFTLDTNGNIVTGGNATIGGILTVPTANIRTGNITDANITTATIGTLTTTGNSTTGGQAVFTGVPTGSAVNQGSVYINPASAASPSSTLLGAAVNGVEKFRVDASGNIYGNNLVLTGGTTTSGNTVATNLQVLDNTILGNAPGDTLVVNAGSTFNNGVTIAGANPFTVGTGATSLGGNLTVAGTTTLNGLIAGTTSLGATNLASAAVAGNATVGGTFGVAGNSAFSTLSTSGLATLNSLQAGSSTLASLAVTNNATIGGTLAVAGNTNVSTLAASGLLSANGGIVTNNADINAGTGTVTGNGLGLTNLNASNLSSGTISDARLSTNVALKNTANTFTANQTVSGNLTATTLTQGTNSVCDISNNCNYASSSGSGNYIQNGTTPQTANFNITGNGTVGGTSTIGGNQTVGGSLAVSGLSSFGTLGAADTATTLCRNSLNQLAACAATGTGAAFVQGGNSFGATANLGTNDAFNLALRTNGITRLTLDTSGNATLTGGLTASAFTGDGTNVTNVNAALLQGNNAAFYQNASNLNAGTIASARLTGNYGGITGTGALSSGSITSGFGTIATANTITATTLNGTTGINTGAGAGTNRIDASGNLVNIGTITSGLINGQTISSAANFTGSIVAASTIQGSQLISTVATGTAPLTVASTTKVTNLNADLLDGLDSTAFATSSGSGSYIQNGTALQSNANFNIQSAAAGSVGGIIRGAAGQTANLLQLQNSAGAVKAYFDNNGNFFDPGFNILGSITLSGSDIYTADGSSTLRLQTFSTGLILAQNDFYAAKTVSIGGSQATSAVVLTVKAAASQTADLFQLQDSSANVLAGFNASGQLNLGRASTTTGQLNLFGSGSANSIALKAPTAPGSGLTLTLPNETGTLCSTGSVCTGYAAATGSGSYIQNGTTLQTAANFNIQSAAAGSVGGIIRGAAGQTADLQQWKDSAGTVLASVNAVGVLSSASADALALTNSSYSRIYSNNALYIDTINASKDIVFRPSGTESLRILGSNGNVGIGTTSPQTALHVAQSSAGGPITGLRISNTASDAVGNAANIQFGLTGLTDVNAAIGAINTGGANKATALTFTTYDPGSGQAERMRITSVGNVGIGTTAPGAQLQQTIGSAGTIGHIIKGAASQTADLFQLQDSSANVLAGFNASGQLNLGRASNTVGQINLFGSGSANSIALKAPTAPGSGLTLTLPNETGTLCSTGSVCTGYAAASGSGSYIQNGTALQTAANFNIQSAAAGSVGGIIRGAASQTADLLQLQDSTGLVLDLFGAAGGLTMRNPAGGGVNSFTVGAAGAVRTYGSLYATDSQFNNQGVPLKVEGFYNQVTSIIKGAAAQTSDLTQFQNSSGTVLSEVTAAGALQGGNGSGTNVAGSALTLNGGQGTGTGAGGNIVFQYAPAGSTGGAANALQTACTISGTNGSLSCAGTGTNTEHFGGGSTTSTFNNVTAVGRGAFTSGDNTAVFGRSSTAALQGTALGDGASAGVTGVAVGYATSTSGSNSVAVGNNAVAGFQGSIAIGRGATTTASFQLVIGSNVSTAQIQDAYIGSGVTNATPLGTTIHATGGSGTDIAGAALQLAGGIGTGAGVGGNINFQIAKPGTTGSTLNALTTVHSINGTTGATSFQNATNSTTAFQIQNSAGTALLTADTTNMKLTVTNVVITANLTVNGHIITGGSTPTIAAGAGAGTGATASITGTDTAGTITITSGAVGMGIGGLATITFATAYGSNAVVTMSPTNSSAATFSTYLTPGTTNFVINAAVAPGISTTYTYTYHVMQ